MKVFSFPFLSPILCHGLRHPVPPTLKLLFSANLTLGIPVDVGLTTFGEKLIVPITDGAFSGPGLNGEVTIGLVTSLTGSQGTQRADLPIIPYVEILFETGSSKYGWLNNVTAWATGTESDGLLSLNFWKVSA
ncbi:hypothetical protein VC83_08974 [Pseudogymnoascus destructans]|uniref:Uncharacterized protein n=1 Tax=Pseudogymnoascus destructans TaxID=655981 RepID=A0A177A0V1_9PEZI|nr:uncharacterized protein VC83_08974 [Pseudogymnoascus destructans]OAF54723.1 hypothetical protein VC83_08974 [Pseudogymnoascus destructans]